MGRILGDIRKGFWAVYPIGTKFTWSFLARQLGTLLQFLSQSEYRLRFYVIPGWRNLQVSLLPELRSFHDTTCKRISENSTAEKIISWPIVCLFYFLVDAFIFLPNFVITTSIMVVLSVLAIIIVGIWAPVISAIFLLWFILYRYPLFEIISPRMRHRILMNNSQVYEPLSAKSFTIRVLRVKAGTRGKVIECELTTGLVSEMRFEALSYVWGTFPVPHRIQVDNKPFYVTYNLYAALNELRQPDQDRLLWIDAICINQYDNEEKGVQVQMMREIYAGASQTIVWLGKGTKAISSTFEFVDEFCNTDIERRTSWWQSRDSRPLMKSIRRELNDMLEHEWWERAWVVQEVVVSKLVVVQRGSHQIEWDRIYTYLAFLPKGYDSPTVRFAKNVQTLRLQNTAHQTSSKSLLDLAYAFRSQAATVGSDKLYALMGLLHVDNASLLEPNYRASPEAVFMQFAVSCLEHTKNLNTIAFAAGVQLQGTSWCRDWRFSNDGGFETSCFSVAQYSASGTHPPIYAASFEDRRLSLQGYEVDAMSSVGDYVRGADNPQSHEWNPKLRAWERVAYLHGPIKQREFDRTITAECWMEEPLDWKQRIAPNGKTAPTGNNVEYKDVIGRSCTNRRFFVTKNGRYGLGPWNTKKGDIVCILLGGKTPFILRPCLARGAKQTLPDEEGGEVAKLYKVVGEAFVDGLMHYEGSMEDDIRTGKVAPTWFHLL
jgi:hypothetical protein